MGPLCVSCDRVDGWRHRFRHRFAGARWRHERARSRAAPGATPPEPAGPAPRRSLAEPVSPAPAHRRAAGIRGADRRDPGRADRSAVSAAPPRCHAAVGDGARGRVGRRGRRDASRGAGGAARPRPATADRGVGGGHRAASAGAATQAASGPRRPGRPAPAGERRRRTQRTPEGRASRPVRDRAADAAAREPALQAGCGVRENEPVVQHLLPARAAGLSAPRRHRRRDPRPPGRHRRRRDRVGEDHPAAEDLPRAGPRGATAS